MKTKKIITLHIWDGIILFVLYMITLATTFLVFKVRIGSIFGLALIIVGSLWFIRKFLESIVLFYEYFILNKVQVEETVFLGYSSSATLNVFYKTEYTLCYLEKRRMGEKPYIIINPPNYQLYSGQNVRIEYLKRSRMVLNIHLVR